MVCAIEDAGFEIRDCLQWLYSQGFPKSHDVSKGIDKAAGALSARGKGFNTAGQNVGPNQNRELRSDHPDYEAYSPRTDSAREWSGWGTALKPACEPIVLARKPLSESTIAANVLRWGTGALNVDGCRIATEEGWQEYVLKTARPNSNGARHDGDVMNRPATPTVNPSALGRWPANVLHDGSDEVVGAFPESAGQQGDLNATGRARPTKTCFGDMAPPLPHPARNDSGSAARFFYTAKADADDRLGFTHPTIKPVDLMQWLVRLVTPRGGLVLDPFAGTGTTGEAAFREGMRAMLFEREGEYQGFIRERMRLCLAGPDERRVATIKRKPEPPKDGLLAMMEEGA
jgi:hypothetical protein